MLRALLVENKQNWSKSLFNCVFLGGGRVVVVLHENTDNSIRGIPKFLSFQSRNGLIIPYSLWNNTRKTFILIKLSSSIRLTIDDNLLCHNNLLLFMLIYLNFSY